MADLKQDLLNKVNHWLTETFDNDTKDIITTLLKSNPKELEESFYKI